MIIKEIDGVEIWITNRINYLNGEIKRIKGRIKLNSLEMELKHREVELKIMDRLKERLKI